MKTIYPEKLKKGDVVRIVAPSRSMAIISQKIRENVNRRFLELGLGLDFGKNIEKKGDF